VERSDQVVSGSDSRYLLYDLITHKQKVYHVSDMKPLVYDPTVTTPLDLASRNYMEFFVEIIVDHRGNFKRKTDLEFLSTGWGMMTMTINGYHIPIYMTPEIFTTT
jgi:hypothetical protein